MNHETSHTGTLFYSHVAGATVSPQGVQAFLHQHHAFMRNEHTSDVLECQD